jgi:hypothetical protein
MRLISQDIVVGLDWTLHESIEVARRAVAKQKRSLVARKIVAGECAQAVCTPSRLIKSGARPGALLASLAQNDVLILQPLGNDESWVCAVRDGLPLHGFDLVTDTQSANNLLAEAMSYVPSASLWGDVPGSKGSISDLFDQVSLAESKKIALRPARYGLLKILFGLVAFFLVLTILLIAFKLWGAISERNIASKAAEGKLLDAEQTQRMLEQKQREFDAAVATAKASLWFSKPVTGQFALWKDVLRKLPFGHQGWIPNSVICELNSCTVTWDRSPLAIRSTRATLPGVLIDGGTPDVALTQIAIPPLDTVSHTTPSDGIARYLSDVAVYGAPPLVSSTVAPPSRPMTVVPPVELTGASPVVIGSEGDWRISSANLAALHAVLNHLDLAGVNAKKLSVSNLGRSFIPGAVGPDILIEGSYRVESK